MANELARYLGNHLTASIKEEARKILLYARPDNIRELEFRCGGVDISLVEDLLSKYQCRCEIKTYIPHDIQMVDVTQSLGKFYSGYNVLFIPNIITAISVYLYFIRPYLCTKIYYRWVSKIIDVLQENDNYEVIGKVLASRIYRSDTNTLDIFIHNDQLHYHEWMGYLEWSFKQK
jgi:hypothetical protein